MDRMTLLTPDALDDAMESVPGWSLVGDKIERRFRYANFIQAFGFMASVALIAEQLNHHPEWSNVYGTVDVAITNHDAGGLTELDIEFARRVSTVAAASPIEP